jgi:hypothetical protein
MSNETILDGALMGAESNYPNDLSSHDLKMLDQEKLANSCRELAISDLLLQFFLLAQNLKATKRVTELSIVAPHYALSSHCCKVK